MKVVGQRKEGLIIADPSLPVCNHEIGTFQTTLKLFDVRKSKSKDDCGDLLKINSNTKSDKESICHASLEILNTSSHLDGSGSVSSSSETKLTRIYSLISVVRRHVIDEGKIKFSASLFLIEQYENNESPDLTELGPRVVEEMKVVEHQDKELRLYLLPSYNDSKTKEESYPEELGQTKSFKNSLIALFLDECVIVYTIETFPLSSSAAHLEILSSECVYKSFWWAQWVPEHKFLALGHTRKAQQSSFDDDDAIINQAKPVLSVLQFHDKYPRENVLNMPLKIESGTGSQSSRCYLAKDPMSFTSTSIGLKLLAHSSGAVYLFYLFSNENESTPPSISYSINLLHHNKNFEVSAKIPQESGNFRRIKVDVCLYSNGQYLTVMGWPYFIHLLDAGVNHEPSHHLIFDLATLVPLSVSYLSLYASSDLVPNDGVKIILEDYSVREIKFNSATLLPLMDATRDIYFQLSCLHLLLVHLGDVNAAKRVIYDAGKNIENLHLKKIFQEFLIGSSYVQTKKQLTSNLEPFLRFLPYCLSAITDFESEKVKIKCQPNSAAVLTMLLSPRQRIFPHGITDVWTILWEINSCLCDLSCRFNHKKIAEKLLLSLQCYKPEALSRASTPMSPSSPMICASIGDIAGMFSRRMQDLQLPFLENESCTANKQEYIFSINLRELSMHLLKERKEWPLHGHTVAGKYVNALVDTARLLCHLICVTVHLHPIKNRDKGFRLIDSLDWEKKMKLFLLFEHYTLAIGEMACPLPQGFAPFFAYLGYRVLPFDQFLWHVRSGTFELQIDLVKTIMADMSDADEGSVGKKLHLISLLPKTRASRVLNGWSHPQSICLRARQHSSDLLSGVVSQAKKSAFVINRKRKGVDAAKHADSCLDMFFRLLTLKASVTDIDLGLLTEATLLSMKEERRLAAKERIVT